MAELKPDANYIQDVHTHLSTLLRPAHTHWEKVDEYLQGAFHVWDEKVPAKANRTHYHPSTAAAIVRKGAATQLADEPKVHRERRTDANGKELVEGNEHSGEIENALKEILDDCSLQEVLLPYKMLGIYGAAYGYAIIESGLDRSVWPKRPPKTASAEKIEEYERAKRNVNPFRIAAPHPSTVLMPFNTKKPKYAVRVEKWLGDDIEHATRIRADRPKRFAPEHLDIFDAAKDRFNEIAIKELWTPDWHALMIEGNHLLFVERNTWGFIPFLHAAAGFSQEYTGTSMTLPEQLGRGLISDVLEGILLQAQRESAAQDLVNKLAYSPLLTKKDPAQLRQALIDGIGGPFEKDDVFWLEYPDVLGRMSEGGAFVDADIQAGTFRRDLSGERQPGVSTVGQQVILSEAAARFFATLAKQTNFLASGNAMQILRLADILGDPVTVGGKTLNPDHLNKDYHVKVTFELIDQIIQMQKTEQLMTAYDKELITGGYVREHGLRIEDEAGMKRDLARERIERMPLTQMMNDAVTARQMGNEEVARLLEEQGKVRLAELELQLTEGGAPSSNGVPGPEGQVPRQPLGSNTVRPAPR